MADCLRRVLAEAAAALDVLMLDLDGVQNIELHHVALEAATAVVWVVDHSPETVSEVQASLIELARPGEQDRNGLPLLTSDRCRFVMVDHKTEADRGPRRRHCVTWDRGAGPCASRHSWRRWPRWVSWQVRST